MVIGKKRREEKRVVSKAFEKSQRMHHVSRVASRGVYIRKLKLLKVELTHRRENRLEGKFGISFGYFLYIAELHEEK